MIVVEFESSGLQDKDTTVRVLDTDKPEHDRILAERTFPPGESIKVARDEYTQPFLWRIELGRDGV